MSGTLNFNTLINYFKIIAYSYKNLFKYNLINNSKLKNSYLENFLLYFLPNNYYYLEP